jgi:hypothetical protein
MTHALITGASKGIGKAIAEELAKRGYHVLLVARSEDLLKDEAKRLAETYSINTDYYATDLSSTEAAENIYDWCRNKNYEINILVNNAGYGLSGSMEKYTVGDNINMMQLNMVTPVSLCRLFLPMLRQQNQSFILNIASSAAYQAVPWLTVYSATKSFILSFSRGLKQELRGSSVSITCICPGATDTNFANRANIGPRGLKAAEKFNMTAESVAEIAINAMLKRKTEVITGFVNKLGAFMAWLLPKSLVEKTAMKIYEP